MPTKPNRAGNQQNYVPAGNGDASGEYGDNATGSNIHFTNFKKPDEVKQQESEQQETKNIGVKIKNEGKEQPDISTIKPHYNGKGQELLTNVLKSGRTQSCGCINYSIGEQNIELLLKENNISYIKEFKFNDLGLYRFDFYLPEYHRLIEFDGKQHFQECGGSWDKNDNLKKRQERDKIKNQYALDNNIDLIRIPYWERDNITIDYILGNKFLIKENC